jgi:D-alanyl-D-alanine carboxypeptidase/D-alanyl-D-alanine-endopeptidase (penicillin-binding protein 4)
MTAAALVAALALAGCGGSGTTTVSVSAGEGTYTVGGPSPTVTTPTTTTGSVAPTATQATATSTTQRTTRSSTLRRLQTVLKRDGRTLGPDVGIGVEDLTTGRMLFSQNLDLAQPPASMEKLYTSAALLWKLGPEARLDTDLFGIGFKKDGIWHGNLYLRGDGDPTLGDGNWNKLYDSGYGPTVPELLSDLRGDGITRVTGHLYADPTRFDEDEGGPATANAPDTPDYQGEMSALVYDHGLTLPPLGPAQTAVREIAVLARQQKITVYADTKLTATPPGATLLAQLQSPPMAVMLKLMLVPSDDLFADLFAKQLGFRFADTGTLEAGAAVMSSVIESRYGITPVIHDGSGLDKADRSTPTDYLTLLSRLLDTPVGDVIRADLPVVGKTGTVQYIGQKTAAVGRCEAKTGTLNNVTNLAGYCSAKDGDTLAFVFMADGPSNGDSDYTFGPMVGAVAGY